MCAVLKSILFTETQVVGQALISTLEAGLGVDFTPEVKQAWTAFYQLVSNKMKEGLQEAYTSRND